MNINDTSTQLLFTTVPIVGITIEGTGVSGTGFFFSYDLEDGRKVPLLITNHHVLKDVIQGRFVINLAEGDAPSCETISVNFDKSFIEGKKLGELDLVAMPVAPVLSMLEENGKRPFYRSIDSGLIPKKSVLDNLAALEQITFIGYPSGLYDDYNKTPLIRQGWTSTPAWNDYKGKREFLVDASVFEGSSGSPAFILNQGSYPTTDGIAIGSRLLFMGVITQTITKEKSEHLDLGTVIRSDAMLDKLKPFVEGLL